MASTAGFEPGPHWWEGIALTTLPPLLRFIGHRAHPPDSGKCPLIWGVPWVEVGLCLLIINQSSKICGIHYLKQQDIKWKSRLTSPGNMACWVPTSALHKFKWDSSCCESCHHNCDKCARKLIYPLCVQSRLESKSVPRMVEFPLV